MADQTCAWVSIQTSTEDLDDRNYCLNAQVPIGSAPKTGRKGAVRDDHLQDLRTRGMAGGEARRRLAVSLHECLKPSVQGTDLALSSLAPEDWLVELARRT